MQWKAHTNSLSLILFLFSLSCVLCAAFYTFHPRYELDGWAVYALFTILLASVASAASIFKYNDQPRSEVFPEKDRIYALILFLVALGFGLYRIDFFSIWLDEEIQADATKGVMSIAKSAAFTQMPLSYYFSALNISWLGLNEWGLRVIPCLFYAASCSLFSLLVHACCSHKLTRILAPLVYLLNPWLIHYAQEGRPYAMMFFCGLLWLHFTRQLLAEETDNHWRGDALALFSSTLLFFLSIAFQPIVLALSALPLLALLATRPAWKKKALTISAVTLISTLLALPLIYLSRQRSISYLQPSLNWSALSPSEMSFSALYAHVTSLLNFPGLVWTLAAAAIILFTLGKRRTYGKALSLREGSLLLSLGLCASYAFLFWALFSLLVRYNLRTRYFMIAYPLALLTVSMCFDYALDKLPARFNANGAKLFLQGAFFLGLLLPQARDLQLVYSTDAFDRWNDNYRTMYEYMKNAGREGDVAYFVPYQNPYIDWEQTGFTSSQFYYKENAPVALANHWEIPPGTTTTDLILKDVRDKHPRQIFLVYADSFPVRTLFQRGPPQPRDFLIHRVPVEGSMVATLRRYFKGIVQSSPEKEYAFRMYDILLSLAELERDAKDCASLLEQFGKLKVANPKLVEIFGAHKKKCSEFGAH